MVCDMTNKIFSSAADAVAGLENAHLQATIGQVPCCHESCQASSDDGTVEHEIPPLSDAAGLVPTAQCPAYKATPRG